jgi:hypothetical protein
MSIEKCNMQKMHIANSGKLVMNMLYEGDI